VILTTLILTFVGTQGQVRLSLREDQPVLRCSVKERTSGEQKYCRFPFIIARKRYDTCTDYKDPDGKKWCSTKTSNSSLSLHVHIGNGGFWGYCQDDCLEKDVGSCTDYADQGFKCVSADQCDDVCDTIVDERGGDDVLTRSAALGCESDKTCSGYNEVCCKRVRREESTTTTTTTTTTTSPAITEYVIPEWANSPVNSAVRGAVLGGDSSLATWKPNGDPDAEGECGLSSDAYFIAGGESAKLGQFPFMAQLGFLNPINQKIEYTCGGSLINKYFVLTAAHCITSIFGEPKEIILNELVVSTEEDCNKEKTTCTTKQKYTPEKIHVHEGWKVGYEYEGDDIALIRLDRPADLVYDEGNSNHVSLVSPICFPWNENLYGFNPVPDHEVVLAGWGFTTGNQAENHAAVANLSVAVDNLQFLKFPDGILSFEECQKSFKGIGVNISSSQQLCTTPPQKGQTGCQGDSGGPLFMRVSDETPYYQIGIVSFGSQGCARTREPTVYTRVSAYADWISSKMEEGIEDTRG